MCLYCSPPGTFCSPHILLAVLCGIVNRRQQQIIEFQNAQIEALLNKLGRMRLLLDDDQRRLLSAKAHAIGCKTLHKKPKGQKGEGKKGTPTLPDYGRVT